MDFAQAILALTNTMDEHQILKLCHIIWCLWKARNEWIFRAKKLSPESIIAQARRMDPPTEKGTSNRLKLVKKNTQVICIPPNTVTILVDASWDVSKNAGWGATWYNQQGHLKGIRARHIHAEDATQGEATAILHTIHQCIATTGNGNQVEVMIVTDCKVLVQAINNNSIEELHSWQAAQVAAECAQKIRDAKNSITVRYTTRKALTGPHMLANWARRNKQQTDTMPPSLGDQTIPNNLEKEFFQVMNEFQAPDGNAGQ